MWPMKALRSITLDYRCIDWRLGRGSGFGQVSLDAFFSHVAPFLRDWHRVNKSKLGDKAVLSLIQIVGEGGGRCPACAVGSKACMGTGRSCKAWRQNAELAMRMSTSHRLRKMIAALLDL